MKQALLFCLCAAAASGLNGQTWVASNGVDTPVCGGRTSPCATFSRAFFNAPAGGRLKALDAGDFGSVIVTHAITIDGSGVALMGGTTAIIIAAGATDRVTIENLTIDSSIAGITAVASVQLYLYNVAIEGSPADGITLNGSDTTGTMTADNIRVTGAAIAGLQNTGFAVTVKNSTFAYAVNGIITAGGDLAPAGSTTIDHCHIASSSTAGITASTGGTVRIDNTEIVNNQAGIVARGGQVISYRTNTFANNITDGTPSLSASEK